METKNIRIESGGTGKKKNEIVGELTENAKKFIEVLGNMDLYDFMKANRLWNGMDQDERVAVISRNLVAEENK